MNVEWCINTSQRSYMWSMYVVKISRSMSTSRTGLWNIEDFKFKTLSISFISVQDQKKLEEKLAKEKEKENEKLEKQKRLERLKEQVNKKPPTNQTNCACRNSVMLRRCYWQPSASLSNISILHMQSRHSEYVLFSRLMWRWIGIPTDC